MKNTIKLFKAIEIKDSSIKKDLIFKDTINNGYILSPEIIGNYTEKELEEIIRVLNKEIGLNSKQMNNSFHKSWTKIKESDIEDLILDQIIHYITVYGFESLGIYNSNNVYIPCEELKLKKVNKDKIKLTVIKGYTKSELKVKLLSLLESGIALKEDTVNSIVDLSLYIGLSEEEIYNINNKEAKIILYDYLNITPKNNVEFLRYIIYKSTKEKLIIKNKYLIDKIKENNNIDIIKFFKTYEKKYGLAKLSEIFYRFKPLFLAFRTNKKMNIYINKIRRLAKTNHKPIKEDYLNNVTKYIKNNSIDLDILKSELEKVNVFRKIRLAYALKLRTKKITSMMFKVRNGKGYAKEYSYNNKKLSEKCFNIVFDSIVLNIDLKDKKIYIPDYIKYSLPATEKQFIDNIPSGSYIDLEKDMIVGVHWEDQKKDIIDLDLSMVNNNTKIGWNGEYRGDENKILFSGDMISAPLPNGASELFYINKHSKNDYVFYLNYYNFDKDIPVPFDIFIAKETVKDFKENYMVNQNNILACIKSSIDKQQKTIGYLRTKENNNRFYFSEIEIGKSNVSGNNKYSMHAKKYLKSYHKNIITLNDLILKSGGIIAKTKEECDIDLSIENLEKDTIINILLNK